VIAVIGRPNVGKSTLVNALVGEHLSIVSPKPQTTRHRILGVVQREGSQLLLVDTPGLHRGGKGSALNRTLNRTAQQSVDGVDAVLVMVDATRLTGEDRDAIALIAELGAPAILAVNKVDKIKQKDRLLPMLAELSESASWHAVVPISATRGTNVEALEAELTAVMPEAPAVFPSDQFTDRSTNFLIAERVREQAMLLLQEEVPYGVMVEVERAEEVEGRLRVHVNIVVERDSQKGIVIGSGGEMLKRIGSRARKSLNTLLGRSVHLELWVKVRDGWSADERALRQLGVDEG
jgi:GTP-binding protein Era